MVNSDERQHGPTPEELGVNLDQDISPPGEGQADVSSLDSAIGAAGGDTHQTVENIARLPDDSEGDGIGATGSGSAYETPSNGDEPSAVELAMQEAERMRAERESSDSSEAIGSDTPPAGEDDTSEPSSNIAGQNGARGRTLRENLRSGQAAHRQKAGLPPVDYGPTVVDGTDNEDGNQTSTEGRIETAEPITVENFEQYKDQGRKVEVNGRRWDVDEVLSDGKVRLSRDKAPIEIQRMQREAEESGGVILESAKRQTVAVDPKELREKGFWIIEQTPDQAEGADVDQDKDASDSSAKNQSVEQNRPSFSRYDGAELNQTGPVKPNPEGWVDPTQPPDWAKDLRMSNEGWDNIGKKIRSGEQVDEKTRDQFLQDAETRMKNGQDIDPQFQDAVMRKLASENEAGTPPPPELAERFEEWSQEHSGEGPFDDLFANLGSKSESENTSSETPVSETGSTTRAGLTNEQEAEYTQLREKFKSNEATIEDLKRMRELSSIQEQASTVEKAREKLLNGESLTPEEWDLLEEEKQKEAAEGEKRNIDKEVEDMGTDLIQRLSRGEKVEPEEFEKFQELIAQRGLEDAGLSEEDAREAIKRSLSSELRGRLAKRETRQQKEAIEKIRELMALEMQLLALPQRLDKLQQSANSLKNKIRAKQAWVGSVSTANNEEARRQRMEMYPLYMQLVNINAEITKSKNSGRVFAAQYRDTMQHVRRKTGVTSFLGRGFLEWGDAKMNNVITSIAMDYKVVEMAMPQAA